MTMTEGNCAKPPPGREARREAKRSEILRAAAQLFAEYGYHETSLDQLSENVGVKKPTLYHYLGNKERMAAECLAIGFGEIRQAATEANDLAGTGAERLSVFLKQFGVICMNDFGRCTVRTGTEMFTGPDAARIRRLRNEARNAMLALIESGIADGSIAPCNPHLLLNGLVGALNWPARWEDESVTAGPECVAADLVTQLSYGFLPR